VGGTPYWLILPAIVGWLTRRHLQSPTASDRSKWSVLGLMVGGTLLAVAWSVAVIPASLLLAAIGVYTILHEEMTPPDA